MSRTCTTSRAVASSAETDSENITSHGTESGTLNKPLPSNTVNEKRIITSYVWGGQVVQWLRRLTPNREIASLPVFLPAGDPESSVIKTR